MLESLNFRSTAHHALYESLKKRADGQTMIGMLV